MIKFTVKGANPIPITCSTDSTDLTNNNKYSLSTLENNKVPNIKDISDNNDDSYRDQYGSVEKTFRLDIKSAENNENAVSYDLPSPRRSLIPRRQFAKTVIEVGQTLKLLVEFKQPIVKCKWYKNSKLLSDNDSVNITTIGVESSLVIKSTEYSDSGEYFAVVKMSCGTSSCYADVIVTKAKVDRQPPKFTKNLPKESQIYEFDETALHCQVEPPNAEVKWYKNDIELFENDLFHFENYSDGHLALTITEPMVIDSGTYKCKVINHTEEISTCGDLQVLEVPQHLYVYTPEIEIVKPLNNAVCSLGSSLYFTCQYSLEDTSRFVAVWYVGKHVVTKTNDSFEVRESLGEYKLKIKKLQRDMSGEIRCQLRIKSSYGPTMPTIQTTGHIAIVPYPYIQCELANCCPSRPRGKIQQAITSAVINKDVKIRADFEGSPPPTIKWFKNGELIEPSETQSWPRQNIEVYPDHTILTVLRLQKEDSGVYQVMFENPAGISATDTRLIIGEAPKNPLNSPVVDVVTEKCILLSWNDAETNKRDRVRYEVEMEQDGLFEKVRDTQETRAEFRNLPRGQLHKFRYRIANTFATTEPSPVASCLLDYPKDPDPPIDMEMQQMDKFHELYTTTYDVLGSGAFGNVLLVNDANGNKFAAKVMKTKLRKKWEAAKREFEVLKRLRHEKLVKVYGAFAETNKCIIVTEYLSGGELFERIVEEDVITESDCVQYVRQICEGIAYMHHQRVAHLDLKAENIMCVRRDLNLIKIIDFGLAHVLDTTTQEIRTMYGTKDYVAPEIIKYDPISFKTDMWNIGVITYVLLSGLLPFAGETWAERSTNIQLVNFNYEDEVFDTISSMAKDFIDKLIVMPPSKRMSAIECLNHMWLAEEPTNKVNKMEKTKENLKTYLANYRSKWHKAGNVLIAARRLRINVENRNGCSSGYGSSASSEPRCPT